MRPGVSLICVHCSNCSKKFCFFFFFGAENPKHFQGKVCEFSFFFLVPHPGSFATLPPPPPPDWWEHLGTPATCNIGSLQTLCDFSEGLCHVTTGVREQRAIFGQLDVVAIQPARLGDSPLAAGQDTAVATPLNLRNVCATRPQMTEQ